MTTATLSAPVVVPASAPVSGDIPTFPIYRLSIEQYHRIAEAGILGPEDRIELIETTTAVHYIANQFKIPKFHITNFTN